MTKKTFSTEKTFLTVAEVEAATVAYFAELDAADEADRVAARLVGDRRPE